MSTFLGRSDYFFIRIKDFCLKVGRSADRNVRRNVDRSQMPVLQKMEKIQQPKIRQSRSRSRSRAKRSKASKPNRSAQMLREDQQQDEEDIEVEYHPQTVFYSFFKILNLFKVW